MMTKVVKKVRPRPNDYRHEECGAVSTIPDDIAHNLVLDPCRYTRYTICSRCGEVPIEECTFVETGQRLSDYRDQLLKAKGTGYHVVRRGIWLLPALFGAFIARAGGVRDMAIGFAIGAVIGLLWGHFPRMLLCKLRWI
jgi:hypothetical protein